MIATMKLTQNRPWVLVAARRKQGSEIARGIARHECQLVPSALLESIRLAGANPLVIPIDDERSERETTQLVEFAHGLVLQGGNDVYSQNGELGEFAEHSRYDPIRDRMETALLKSFVGQRKPVLGICRGCQLINVAYGGTLTPVPDHCARHSDPFLHNRYTHRVKLLPGGELAAIFGREDGFVNSIHEQSILVVADGLVEEARSEDGIIEAVASVSKQSFLVGVQWHPEWGVENGLLGTRLFDAFAKACAGRA